MKKTRRIKAHKGYAVLNNRGQIIEISMNDSWLRGMFPFSIRQGINKIVPCSITLLPNRPKRK